MSTLAIHGGTPEVKGPIRPFRTIGKEEIDAAITAMACGPLSGYLGGEKRGGYWVNALEDKWAETLGVRHAIAVNSATSGLMAAAFAVGLKAGDEFICPAMTMSATAAAPMFTGATPYFLDIRPEDFCIDWGAAFRFPQVKAMFVTNLFGHPAHLQYLRRQCDAETRMRGGKTLYLIEDNAQAALAMEYGKYTGTIGHIGIFSLNVHKHLQCGEGGICVTNDDALADAIRAFANHAELGPQTTTTRLGLNLRLTEVSAAIALAQLAKADEIIAGRIALAEALTAATKGLPGIIPPVVREGCKHVYYAWAAKYYPPDHPDGTPDRDWFVRAMQAEGVPLRAGYSPPLYHLPAFAKWKRPCPVAEELHKRLVLFEVCAWDPTGEQVKQIGNAFHKVGEYIRYEGRGRIRV